ncbi:MAG: 2TM domain-containing protein [Defluviitaleaceae bacterium]|nr:2TM domain-containing protein [Defluviitaleaceae bacterium]
MESKVILYDSNDVKIGETFVRRARQLVKQQRAYWINDNHDAIRFAPGMENMSDTEPDDAHESYEAHSSDTDHRIMRLAKRRVYARVGMRIHCSVVVALSVFFLAIYMFTTPGGYFWPIWPMSALWLSVAIHWVVYKFSGGMHTEIATEYEMLKHRYDR